jgi:hypothetical protein
MIRFAIGGVFRRLALCIFALLLALSDYTGRSYAVMLAPQPIDKPVPSEWRNPVVQFMRELGVRDVEAMLASTKVTWIGGYLPNSGDLIIFRFESVCHENRCLTVLGHMDDQGFQSEAMFVAGKMVTWGDVANDIFGNPGPPAIYFLVGNDPANDPGLVTLLKTRKGWIVARG